MPIYIIKALGDTWYQVFYVAVPGANMKEHLEVAYSIVLLLQFCRGRRCRKFKLLFLHVFMCL